MKQLLRLNSRFSGYLHDLIFANYCPSCGINVAYPNTMCHTCWSKITFITGNTCKSCGRPEHFGFAYHNYCNNICFKHRYTFSSIKASCIYSNSIKKVIHGFKYEDKTMYIDIIGKFLSHVLPYVSDIDAIIPVPLHKSRLRERGYNQSAIIAKHVSSILRKPCLFDCLIRKYNTPKQMSLSKKMRTSNIRGAFTVPKTKATSFSGLKILLVDDIITTGATIRECARIIKTYNALTVSALAIART